MAMLRAVSWTYAAIGAFGYMLAGVGLAGVTAYSVQRRRREIGIRMALGARSVAVLALVMKEGAVLVTIGTAIGLAGAWAAARGMAAFSAAGARVTSTGIDDPTILGGSALLVAFLALAACYLPARRSAKVDPAVALRQD